MQVLYCCPTYCCTGVEQQQRQEREQQAAQQTDRWFLGGVMLNVRYQYYFLLLYEYIRMREAVVTQILL